MKRFVLAGLLLATIAHAAVEGPGKDQFIQSVRTQAHVEIDGRLDEGDWRTAPVFDAFSQRFPKPGEAPSEKTELRVLYDDKFVYFGLHCHDSKPDTILRRLARRDSFPSSDAVQVSIDPTHDHRTAYMFFLNAGGVQSDGLFYDDRYFTGDWDAIWDGAAAAVTDGWTAELKIPLSLLHFPTAEVQTWGIDVRRDLPRMNEEIDSVANPRDSNANVSRFGHLTGLRGVKPERAVELQPSLATRAVVRPQYSDQPRPRLTDPSGDVGLDLKLPLTTDLTLVGTINPDFGQVEADQILQNLSNFELFFPEKRPFFTQGMELFQPVGAFAGSNQSLFYSRRIGLESPILGAAKVTGTAVKGVEVGLLDAFVAGSGQGLVDEAAPDRRIAYRFERPFHLGLTDELPDAKPTPMNYLAAVARTSVGGNSNVGAMFTSATPLAPECTIAEDQLSTDLEAGVLRPSRCDVHAGNAASLRFDLKSGDSAYGVLGQVVGSQSTGGAPFRLLADGTRLDRGDFGAGGMLRAGKIGGDGFRWDVAYDYSSPKLYLRPSGYLRTQNEHNGSASLRYANQRGFGPLKSFFFNSTVGSRFTSDGRGIVRGSYVNLNVQGALPSFDFVGAEVGIDFNENDVREIQGTRNLAYDGQQYAYWGGTGIPLERPPAMFLVTFGETNPNRPVSVGYFAAMGLRKDQAPGRSPIGWGANLQITWRPTDALETSLEVADDMTPHGPRFVDELGSNRFLFAELESQFLSWTLRQQVMITPRLSVQAYGQLFTDFGHYGPYYEGQYAAGQRTIRVADLQPTGDPGFNPDFYDVRLNVNVVLRWEYSLGSTLYLVYTRNQALTVDESSGAIPRTLAPTGLSRAPATDSFLVKWSWYWNV